MNTKTLSTNRRQIYLTVGIAGLLIISFLYYGFNKGILMSSKYTLLIDAAMEIKFEATTAHLWFEEILSGDRNEEMEQVWKHLDQADWYAKAMLEGGQNQEGTFLPLEDKELRQRIVSVRAMLSEFREATLSRLEKIDISAAGTAIDQQYDRIFMDFITQADKVETDLQNLIIKELHQFKVIQVTLIILAVFITLFVGVVLVRSDKTLLNSQDRYRTLFDESPVPMWEEDFSAVKKEVDILKKKGISDFKNYFKTNPDKIAEYAEKIKILEINKAVLKLHGAKTKEELLQGLPIIFTEKSFDSFKEELVAIAEGRSKCEFEGEIKTLAGEVKNVHLIWSVVPGYEQTMEKVYISSVDITKRKQAEEMSKTSAAQIKSLVDGREESIWSIDRDYHYLFFNDFFKKAYLVAYNVELKNGMHALNIQSPENRNFWKPKYDFALTGEKVSFEFSYEFSDEKHFYLVSLNPIFMDGEVTGVSAISVDITNNKKAELALKESEQRFSAIAEQSAEGITVATPEGDYVFVNPAFCKMMGYTKEELLKMTVFDMKKDKGEAGKKGFKKSKSKKEGALIEVELQRKDKSTFFSEVSGKPIKIGDTDLVLGIVKDITERRQAEEAVRVSEEKYRALYDNAPLAYQSLDEDGNFMDVNPAWLSILGYQREEVIGAWFGDFLHPDWKPHFDKNFPAFKKRGYVHDVHFKIKHKKGHILDILFEGCIGYTTDGRFKQTYCVFQNITERKQAEEALVTSEERYRGVVEDTPVLICTFLAEGEILFVNKTYCDYFGKTLDELVGSKFQLLIPEDERETVMGNILALSEDSPIQMHEHQVIVSGKKRWQRWTNRAMFGALGKIDSYQSIGEDITERKVAEKALKQSEEKYRLFFENNDAIILLLNPEDGKIIFANEAAVKFYGYKKEKLSGMSINKINTLEPDEIKQKMIEARQRNQNYFIFKHKLANGELRDVEVYQTKLFFNNQNVFSIIVHDITERKQAEEELILSESKFKSLVENSFNGIFTINDQQEFTFVNQSMVKLFGYPENEIIGSNFQKFLTEESLELVTERYLKRQKGEIVPARYEFTIKRKSGEKRNVEISSAIIKQEDGKPVTIAHLSDITERKSSERELNQEKEKVETYLKIADVFMVAINNRGNVTMINKKGCDILGYEENEVLGKNWFKNFVPQKEKEIIEPVFKQLINGQVKPVEFFENYVLTKNGEERLIFWHNSLIVNEKNNIIGTLSSGEDITERKAAEEEKKQLEVHLRQQQKLEAIGTLAGGVAHEINNPITGIMNYAQLISERLEPDSRLKEFADGIGRETDRVAKIVSNLLTYARQEKETHSPARIEDIINNTISLINTIVRRDQIELRVDVPKDLPNLKCRSQQIQQVIMNLLTNARDALNQKFPEYDPDKTIELKVRPFDKDGRRWFQITVKDNGSGIPDEIKERLFDPFFTTKDRTKGTGLGLAISLGIVQDHHGELTFESERGEYTRFNLILPVDNGWEI